MIAVSRVNELEANLRVAIVPRYLDINIPRTAVPSAILYHNYCKIQIRCSFEQPIEIRVKNTYEKQVRVYA